MSYDDPMTRVLTWHKPVPHRPHAEHVAAYVADGAPPGAFVPNMSREEQDRWKAQYVGGNSPRVEIRKRVVHSLMKVVVDAHGVSLSANGKLLMDNETWTDLVEAVREAREALRRGGAPT